jgi:hypothetical protein
VRARERRTAPGSLCPCVCAISGPCSFLLGSGGSDVKQSRESALPLELYRLFCGS